MPLFSVVMIRIAAVINTRYKAIQDYFGRISTFIQENLSGIRVVKAYTQEPAQNAAFDQLNLAYLEKNRAYIRTRANYRPLSYVIASLCLGLNLWLGGRAVIDGELSLGAFVAFNAYLTQLIRPIMYIGWVIDRAQRALVSMQRINEILAVEPEIQDRALGLSDSTERSTERSRRSLAEVSGVRRAQPSRRSPPPATPQPIAGHIAFRKLSFSYGEEQVLHQIDLEIPQGTTLGIIGRGGSSGKTTLARLVPRLIQAGPGQLLIDGVPTEEWPLATLRDAIGYVPQNPFLFSNTLSANLAYGADSAAEAPDPRCGRRGPAQKGHRPIRRGLRHPHRRARRHSVRRPKAARDLGPRAHSPPADTHPRRCTRRSGYPYRRSDPRPFARPHAGPHHPHHRPPHLDPAPRRSHRRARRRSHRRTGHSRRSWSTAAASTPSCTSTSSFAPS